MRSGMTFSSTLLVNNRQLDLMLNGVRGDVYNHLIRRGRAIIFAAKAQVGVDTGTLRKSLHLRHSRFSNGQSIWIGSNEPHALIHHEGTRPHWIKPDKAPVMRFSAGGRMVYSRAVRHPGTRPNRYLSDNLYIAYL